MCFPHSVWELIQTTLCGSESDVPAEPGRSLSSAHHPCARHGGTVQRSLITVLLPSTATTCRPTPRAKRRFLAECDWPLPACHVAMEKLDFHTSLERMQWRLYGRVSGRPFVILSLQSGADLIKVWWILMIAGRKSGSVRIQLQEKKRLSQTDLHLVSPEKNGKDKIWWIKNTTAIIWIFISSLSPRSSARPPCKIHYTPSIIY